MSRPALPPRFEARLVATRALAPSVRELTFERLDGQPMAFEPGQWLSAFLPVEGAAAPVPGTIAENAPLKRSYSIASPPNGSPRFEIAVTRVQDGSGSTWLHAVDCGATLVFVGPQGFFTRAAASPPPSLMIATGTGITPMRSMVGASLANGARAPTWILLGVRREEDLLYADEFEAMARAHPFVRFEATLSRPGAAWAGRRGYVQAHVRELWTALGSMGAGEPHAYVCGLERMVGSVRELLRKDMGAARQQVHSERYD
jgi:ferredoxin-NADP reductase